jgi:hypothetical protein
VKPLAELSLVLYALSRRPATAALARWARRLGARLAPAAEACCAHLPLSLATPEMLLPVVGLAQATGRRSAAYGAALEILAAALAKEAPVELKTAFVADLAGLHDCRAAAESALAAARTEWDVEPAPRPSLLYGWTHAIFYATRLGTRPLSCPASAVQSLADRLSALAAERISALRFDIGAELLAAVAWIEPPVLPRSFHRARRALAVLARSRGCVPTEPPEARRPAAGDEFTRCYHATLIALAALASPGFARLQADRKEVA